MMAEESKSAATGNLDVVNTVVPKADNEDTADTADPAIADVEHPGQEIHEVIHDSQNSASDTQFESKNEKKENKE